MYISKYSRDPSKLRVYIKTPNGVRSKVCSSEQEAQIWAEDFTSLQSLLTTYRDNLPKLDLATTTKRTYTECLNKLLRYSSPSLLKKDANEVTARDLAGYLKSREVSGPTKRLELNILSNAFKYQGYASPVLDHIRPRAGKPRDRRLFNTEVHGFNEEKALFDELAGQPNEQVTLVARIALATAARLNEILALTLGDISDVIFIRKGKGGKSRYVPSSPALRQHLADYTLKLGIVNPAQKLFTVTDKSFQTLFRRVVERVRKKHPQLPSLSIHNLRHEAISRFVEVSGANQWSINDIAQITGHSGDLHTLYRVYIHLFSKQTAQKFSTKSTEQISGASA